MSSCIGLWDYAHTRDILCKLFLNVIEFAAALRPTMSCNLRTYTKEEGEEDGYYFMMTAFSLSGIKHTFYTLALKLLVKANV